MHTIAHDVHMLYLSISASRHLSILASQHLSTETLTMNIELNPPFSSLLGVVLQVLRVRHRRHAALRGED